MGFFCHGSDLLTCRFKVWDFVSPKIFWVVFYHFDVNSLVLL